MAMLDGPYWVVYLGGGLEGVVEAKGDVFERLLKVLREDFQEMSPRKSPDEEFGLTLKFDTYTLTWNGKPMTKWFAVNVQNID